jgi:hypothetical protein
MAVALAAVAASTAVPVASADPQVKARVDDGTLHIQGSPHKDAITLRLNAADPNQLQVDVGDDNTADFTFGLNTFNAIDVKAGEGDDTIRIDQVNGVFTTTKATRINGQGGDDLIIGGSGAETLVGGRGDDTILGGSGAETLIGGSGNDLIDGNGGVDTAFMGKGDDTFVWDPGDGSDVVEGGKGVDTMVFNGAAGNEIMAATANGGRVSFTRNLGGIVMDLDGIETIDVRALGGTDTVTVNDVTGTDLARVDVDLAGPLGGSTSDGAADTVTVKGTDGVDTIAATANGSAVEVSGLSALVRITHTDPTLDSLVIDTRAGTDTVTVAPAVAGLILASIL